MIKEMDIMDIMRLGTDSIVKFLPLAVLTIVSACAQARLAERPAISEPPTVAAETAAATTKLPQGPVTLRPDHPQTYVVAAGDTSFDIAAKFLETPWRWPEVWRPDPGVSDPNAIYPGDVIELYYEGDQPRLRLAKERANLKLSPQVRVETLSQPIPPIPRSAVESFLMRTLVASNADWELAPRIVSNVDGRVVVGAGDRVYIRGILSSDQRFFRVFRRGEEYRDPITKQSLGVGGIYVSDAVLQQEGDPATLVLTATRRDVRAGDRVFPVEDEVEVYNFIPHAPPPDTEGRVIAVQGKTLLVGQYQGVVVNLGEESGMEPGHLLKIHTVGRHVRYPATYSLIGSTVRLPDEEVGLLMIYRVHDRISYGLVMTANRIVHTGDRVTDP
jgi:hypothetical protein